MSTIRYTLGGNYDPSNSDVPRHTAGYDFNDPSLTWIGPKYFDSLMFGIGDNVTFLHTPDSITLNISNSSIFVDFSDRTAGVSLTGGYFGDYLRSGSGNDTLNGGAGDDILEAGPGNNIIDGGSGSNTISYEYLNDNAASGTSIYVDIRYQFSTNIGGSLVNDTLVNIQNVIGSSFRDYFNGSEANNVFEGGAGADQITGYGGTDTASYEQSSSGVNVNLTWGVNTGGDAQGDILDDIENLLGSHFADILTGDVGANTLDGNGGSDSLFGMDGDDRLLNSETPTLVDGGTGKDFLIVTGGGSVSLSEGAFTGIEAVYVRDDTTLDMSLVETGSKVVSQSTAGHSVSIIGTTSNDSIIGGKALDSLFGGAGNDRITAKAGGAVIDGGTGSDKLFAGTGSDTFHFGAEFGRDNGYNFDVTFDHFDFSHLVETFDDIEIKSFHGGQDTLITFGAEIDHAYKIILHDVAASALSADNFMFA